MIETIVDHVIPAALSILPAKMDRPEARTMLLAIGLQETRFLNRRQIGNSNAALSFWQFEPGELALLPGIFRHPSTRDLARHVAERLRYDANDVERLRRATEHNDVLACALARLGLWTLPDALPSSAEAGIAWDQYLRAWRPGRPQPATWSGLYSEAVARVEQQTVLKA